MTAENSKASLLLPKIDSKGASAGHVEVTSEVFGLEPNLHVLHLAVRREQANARSGSASSKTRAEVRGGGKKPWKQKGTGRARAGSTRSPLWAGGGVIFGPKPRDYSFKLPRKVRLLAMRSSLSAAQSKIKVVESFSFLTSAKTKEVRQFLKALDLCAKESKILILAHNDEQNQNLALSCRNLQNVGVSLPHNLSIQDLMKAEVILATAAAVQEINERYAPYA
jgi:large subunit ribosomal protein L4